MRIEKLNHDFLECPVPSLKRQYGSLSKFAPDPSRVFVCLLPSHMSPQI